MSTVVELLSTFMNLIKNIATNISNTFTGTDSGATLVMIIFYLTSILVLFFLLWLFVKVVKSFFHSLFRRRKRKNCSRNAVKQADNIELTAAASDNQDSDLSVIESFDSQLYLDLLSLKQKAIISATGGDDAFLEITDETPQPLTVSSPAPQKSVSAEEESQIIAAIDGKDLSALRLFLNREEQKASEISLRSSTIEHHLSTTLDARARKTAEEGASLKKYNLCVGEWRSLASDLETSKAQLSEEHAKLFKRALNLGISKFDILKNIHSLAEEIRGLPGVVQDFDAELNRKINASVMSIQQKAASLSSLKDGYVSIKNSRIKMDGEISALQQELASAAKELFYHNELLLRLNAKIDELEKGEAERLAQQEAERLEREKAERLAREEEVRRAKEEAARLAREQAEQAKREENKRAAETTLNESQIKSTEEQTPPSAVDAAKAIVEKQAQGAYALNYENLTPEMYEKIAAAKRNKPQSAPGGMTPCQPSYAFVTADVDKANVTPTTSDKPTKATPGAEKDREEAEGKPDYFGELQKQWAAEREHRYQWEAEKAAREAEAERRRKLLSETNSEGAN